MKKLSKVLALLLALSLLLSMAACGKPVATPTEAPTDPLEETPTVQPLDTGTASMLIDMYDSYCIYGACRVGREVDEATGRAVVVAAGFPEDYYMNVIMVYKVDQWNTAAEARAYAEYYVNSQILPEDHDNSVEYNGSLYALVGAMGFGSYYPQELIKVDEVTYMTELYHDEADDIVGTAYFRWTGDHWILQEMG